MTSTSPSRNWIWVLLAAVVTFFTGLGTTRLWDEDEGFFAATALEMHHRNEWVVPYYNGEVFAHKPPLMYWAMRVGFYAFGENEWGARIGSALFGTAAALLTQWVAARLFDRRTGLLAGLAMASCIMFGVVSRASTADAYLVFFITLVMAAYVRGTRWFDETTGLPQTLTSTELIAVLLPSSWLGFLAMYAAMGMAVLVKGPVGILLPGTAIGLFVLWQVASSQTTWSGWLKQFASHIPRVFWAMRPFTAIGVVVTISGWWFAAVESRTGGGFLGEFIGFHNIQRFLTPMEKHSGPIVYYIPVVWVGFFPWSLFAVPAAITLKRRLADRPAEPAAIRRQAAWRLVLCWFSVIFVFFSIAKTKLPNYVLPCYPPLAILVAGFMARWLEEPAANLRFWGRWAFGSLASVGVACLILVPAVGLIRVDGLPLLVKAELHPDIASRLWPVGLIGLPALIGGVICWRYLQREQPRLLLTAFSITAVLFVLGVLGGAATYLNQFQSSAQIAQAVRDASLHPTPKSAIQLVSHSEEDAPISSDSQSPTPVAIFRLNSPSLIYYTQQTLHQPLVKVSRPEEIVRHLAQRDSLLITTDLGWDQLPEEIRQSLILVAERPRFPKPGQVLVLKSPGIPVASEAILPVR